MKFEYTPFHLLRVGDMIRRADGDATVFSTEDLRLIRLMPLPVLPIHPTPPT